MGNIETGKILESYYRTKDTKDLAWLFKRYMQEIGATKLDRRKKDTSNTYQIDGDSTDWNRVECCYYRNSGDHRHHGKFEFNMVFRKRAGDYLLIEMGSPSGDIARPYEISCGKVLRHDKELMEELIKKHPKLFEMMCEQLFTAAVIKTDREETWRMGDLISRKALMDALRGNVLIDVTPELENTVLEQPTAFDLESVIAELEKKRDLCYAEMEKERNNTDCFSGHIFDEYHNKGMAYNDCLEIFTSTTNATNGKIGSD